MKGTVGLSAKTSVVWTDAANRRSAAVDPSVCKPLLPSLARRAGRAAVFARLG